MKRLVVAMVLVVALVFSTTSAFAVGILPKDGEKSALTVPTELTEFPDERAVQIGDTDANVEASFAEWEDGVMDPDVYYSYMEENELLDDGGVWISWNDEAYSKYGCTTASINYTNPSGSNIGVVLRMAIFDEDLLSYFGTTFRDEDEVLELALCGLDALENGIHPTNAKKLIENNELFSGMSEEEFDVEPSELPKLLASKGFLGMTEEELASLDKATVNSLSEVDKLALAELADYDPAVWYMEIAKAGVIKPGFALYEIDLHTLPGQICLPKGEYKAVFVLNGYDAWKSETSDFFINLPITLEVKEDLPVELQVEYGITLAERID